MVVRQRERGPTLSVYPTGVSARKVKTAPREGISSRVGVQLEPYIPNKMTYVVSSRTEGIVNQMLGAVSLKVGP